MDASDILTFLPRKIKNPKSPSQNQNLKQKSGRETHAAPDENIGGCAWIDFGVYVGCFFGGCGVGI